MKRVNVFIILIVMGLLLLFISVFNSVLYTQKSISCIGRSTEEKAGKEKLTQMGYVPTTSVVSPKEKNEVSINIPKLKLLATVLGGYRDPRAIIRNERTSEKNAYAAGDTIEGFKLVDIQLGSVILRCEDVEITLTTQEDDAVTSVSKSEKHIDKDLLIQEVKNSNHIFSQGKFLPYIDEGKFKGIKIESFKDKPMLNKAGLKEKDIVLAVNGESIVSIPSCFKIYEKVKNKPVIYVKILRQGSVKDLKFVMY
ncbi:MAG: hypothetical protein COS99_01800 [Candidatus Omnitrophica bacterium CG07_land_8_20_14_0_80_42_15]|uniref:PDZ domain-containing protein n=1 Tax=Candidatus Aquitaenariimonas noxiae TaxID=1974741 RepID=A0A2J0KUD9_9BACT|nr:MAG: hypothetical protein COS99_01800 [Candidatus Omnitrophica bacterium CG07_land_8_20_14_0_80_42_15]